MGGFEGGSFAVWVCGGEDWLEVVGGAADAEAAAGGNVGVDHGGVEVLVA